MTAAARFFEPKDAIPAARQRFSNAGLRRLILPLLAEQFLVMLVGIVDTMMISSAGEAAVSGVSLVNQFNVIFIYLFTALASGGAVVVSQYLGSRDGDGANLSAGQLLMLSTVFSVGMLALVELFCGPLLHLLFGQVDAAVMDSCVIYLRISALCYPALAIYNTGAALYRSMGRTSVTLYISIIANLINVVGNAIGVYVLHAGVAGVAWPTFAANVFSAAAVAVLCFQKSNAVRFTLRGIFGWHGRMLRRILGIAVPNGVENGLFQLAKVALSSIVALFGTSQIAANGVAQSFWGMAALVSSAMAPAFITVVGQCMGAGDPGAAEYYLKKLLRITFTASIVWNAAVLAAAPLVMPLYALPADTVRLILVLILIHNVFNATLLPLSSPLAAGLRAAGDVRFTMVVSILSTVGFRVALSVVLGVVCHLGVIGIALAMCADWGLRALIFTRRARSGVWKTFRVI
jgi:putative MATE family efflux protein